MVLELLKEDEAETHEEDGIAIPSGRVVGVITPHRSHTGVTVCRLEGGQGGVMTPVTRGMSPMRVVVGQQHLERCRKGYVCVYGAGREIHHYEAVDEVEPESTIFAVR